MRAGALGSVVAGVLLVVACGNPAPINASAASLLLGKSDTGGWAVEVQPLANCYGFWGPLAMFNGSTAYQRFFGINFMFFGLITYCMAISWFGRHVHTAT